MIALDHNLNCTNHLIFGAAIRVLSVLSDKTAFATLVFIGLIVVPVQTASALADWKKLSDQSHQPHFLPIGVKTMDNEQKEEGTDNAQYQQATLFASSLQEIKQLLDGLNVELVGRGPRKLPDGRYAVEIIATPDVLRKLPANKLKVFDLKPKAIGEEVSQSNRYERIALLPRALVRSCPTNREPRCTQPCGNRDWPISASQYLSDNMSEVYVSQRNFRGPNCTRNTYRYSRRTYRGRVFRRHTCPRMGESGDLPVCGR